MSESQKIEAAKGAICILLPLLAVLASRWRAVGHRRRGLILLSVLAAISVGLYVRNATLAEPPYLDAHDVFHYYLTARYYPELREDLLYDCTVVADAELPRPLLTEAVTVRDLRTLVAVPRADVMARASRCHEAFTPVRWTAFKEDLKHLERYFTPATMASAVSDLGTNASPTWLVTGGALARSVPVGRLAWIIHVDTVLILGMLIGVGWAFDAEAALVATALLSAFFWSHNPQIGGAILRFDWLVGSVAALCLWKKKRPVLAGGALAIAAGTKLCPVLLGAGVVARGVGRLVRTRRLPREESRFVGGLAATLALLCGLALASYGPQLFRDYEAKMAVFEDHVDAYRLGLPIAAAWRGELPRSADEAGRVLGQKQALYKTEAPALRGLALLAGLAVLIAGARREISDERAWLLGAALIPLSSQMMFYYYAFLLLPAILHAWRLPKGAATAGLFAVCWASGMGDITDAAGWNAYTACAPASALTCLWAVAVIFRVGVAPQSG